MFFYSFLNLDWSSFNLFFSIYWKISCIDTFNWSIRLRRLNCNTLVSSKFAQKLNLEHAQIFPFFMLNFNQIWWENIRLLQTDIFWSTINPAFEFFYFAETMICIVLNCKGQIFRNFVVLNSKLYKNKFWNFFELFNRLYDFDRRNFP